MSSITDNLVGPGEYTEPPRLAKINYECDADALGIRAHVRNKGCPLIPTTSFTADRLRQLISGRICA